MRGTLSDDTYTKKEDESNKLRLGGGSWTINLDELPDEAQTIRYVTSLRAYAIGRDDAFEHGFVRQLGGENKLVVPLKFWWVE